MRVVSTGSEGGGGHGQGLLGEGREEGVELLLLLLGGLGRRLRFAPLGLGPWRMQCQRSLGMLGLSTLVTRTRTTHRAWWRRGGGRGWWCRCWRPPRRPLQRSPSPAASHDQKPVCVRMRACGVCVVSCVVCHVTPWNVSSRTFFPLTARFRLSTSSGRWSGLADTSACTGPGACSSRTRSGGTSIRPAGRVGGVNHG